MDITKMSKTELESLQKQIDEQKQKIKDEELNQRRQEAKKKIDKLRENKDVLLEVIEHTRTSCSDNNVCNGYGGNSYDTRYARCTKCQLIDILNDDWSNSWEIDIEVSITRIE